MLSSLMLVTAIALVLPTALYSTAVHKGPNFDATILSYSRATATVLLAVYVVYLYFQLITHSAMFEEVEADDDAPTEDVASTSQHTERRMADCEATETSDQAPSMNEIGVAFVKLVVSGVLIGACTHYFMESIDGMTETLNVTKAFVALIIIPIASNAPEISQVVAAAKKQNVDFAVTVIVGSILQIALFVLPILVIIGWMINRPMDFYFDQSQTYVLLFSVVLVNQVLLDRFYTYLHGTMLLCV